MVRHTVSGYFTLLRDLNLETLILTSHSVSLFRPMGKKKILAIKKKDQNCRQFHVTNCCSAAVVTATSAVTELPGTRSKVRLTDCVDWFYY